MSLVPESYHDSYHYFEPEPHDLTGLDFFYMDAESWLGIDYDDGQVHRVDSFDAYSVLMEEHSYAYHGQSCVDVAETMGGEGRTTQVLVRRGYEGGENFDCVVGCDLMRADDEQ